MSWEKVTQAGSRYLLNLTRSSPLPSPSGSASSGWETVDTLDETFPVDSMQLYIPSPSMTLLNLPPEILLLIAECLTTSHDILSLILVNRHLHILITPTLHNFALAHHSLGWAARKGYEPLVRLLLNKGVAVDSRINSYGKTAIHYAACEGRDSIVQLLLDRGANINIQGASGQTALHFAALNGHEEIVRMLLDRGADVTIQNSAGLTALLLAIRYSNSKESEVIFRLLLENGAYVDAQESYTGWTALHWAVLREQEDTVRLLLEKGASIRVMTRRGAKETPVHWALKSGKADMVVLLLEKGLRDRQKRVIGVDRAQKGR